MMLSQRRSYDSHVLLSDDVYIADGRFGETVLKDMKSGKSMLEGVKLSFPRRRESIECVDVKWTLAFAGVIKPVPRLYKSKLLKQSLDICRAQLCLRNW